MTALPRAPVLALGALALLAILALSTAAMAQTARPGSSAPGMEENRREARLLADTLEIPRHAEDLMVRMRAEMIQATTRTSDLDEAGATAVVDEILMPNFRARAGELVAEMIEPYAVNFTFTDLRGLRAFYASPLGQKLLRVQPVARAQADEAGLAWGQRLFKDSVDRHVDELRARGLKF